MTPEHTALVAELEARALYDPKYGRNCKDQMSLRSAAAIRALAGEVEQLEEELETAEAVHDGVALERDTLRAEIERLTAWVATAQAAIKHNNEAAHDQRQLFRKANAELRTERAELRAEVAALRKALGEVMPLLDECDCTDSDRTDMLCPCKAARAALADKQEET